MPFPESIAIFVAGRWARQCVRITDQRRRFTRGTIQPYHRHPVICTRVVWQKRYRAIKPAIWTRPMSQTLGNGQLVLSHILFVRFRFDSSSIDRPSYIINRFTDRLSTDRLSISTSWLSRRYTVVSQELQNR